MVGLILWYVLWSTLPLEQHLDAFSQLFLTGSNRKAIESVLAGSVAITACSGVVGPYFAVLIGLFGAVLYHAAVKLLVICKIDDPVEAFSVHGAVGFWGLIAADLFNHPTLQKVAGYPTQGAGLVYDGAGSGKLLGANIIGGGVIALWSAFFAFIYFGFPDDESNIVDKPTGQPNFGANE